MTLWTEWMRCAHALGGACRRHRTSLWLMVVLVVGLVIGFGVLFVGFHRIFFEGDSWLFSYSDTFIRLYPERFWRDTFALVAIVTLSLALLLIWLPKRIIKPSS